MSILHHPSDQTLGAFASGTLDTGRHVVVSAHIEMCPSCQRMVAALDRLGGARLAQLPGTALASDALDKALSRLSEPPSAPPVAPRPESDLPVRIAALAPYTLGRWRWIGWGVHTRTASVPEPGGARVFLLKAAPGTRLPYHTHTGTELTLILQGAFTHAGGRFGVGDLDDADETVLHQPIVEPGEDCICLVAMRGQLRLPGWLGQLLQPFVRL